MLYLAKNGENDKKLNIEQKMVKITVSSKNTEICKKNGQNDEKYVI
jgi:hypothetical protein